jgi:hypothetical protein
MPPPGGSGFQIQDTEIAAAPGTISSGFTKSYICYMIYWTFLVPNFDRR